MQNGWNVVHTKTSDITDLISTKDQKTHYVKIKSEFIDKSLTEGPTLNNFVQHSMSGKADPVLAEVSGKITKETNELVISKVAFTNANTNARVVITQRKPKTSAAENIKL